ncbi:hypothetical protein G6F50_017155 [Rhizopus delemar]|uniref:Uncharacterized protein n=1 Tax=Rhizopus delemar TaxID=936053 RepID=A0A9P6XR03_9FUNG|nr:hypothetical protein G6F50_017155 [Rhizopus delemar]
MLSSAWRPAIRSSWRTWPSWGPMWTRHPGPPRAHAVPAGHQPRQLGADPLHAGHGADRHADQRVHQGRLAGSAALRAGHRGGADPRDAADDRHGHARQGRIAHVGP